MGRWVIQRVSDEGGVAKACAKRKCCRQQNECKAGIRSRKTCNEIKRNQGRNGTLLAVKVVGAVLLPRHRQRRRNGWRGEREKGRVRKGAQLEVERLQVCNQRMKRMILITMSLLNMNGRSHIRGRVVC